MSKDKLGDSFKAVESAWDVVLPPFTPLIMRLDGNNFHALTKNVGFEKPFDDVFFDCMAETAQAVMEYCSNARVAYVQSDEISIVLLNSEGSDPFLGNRVQKLDSLCASVASVTFTKALREKRGVDTPVIFDCRIFALPEQQVNPYMNWRQLDSFKNAVSSFAYYELCKQENYKVAHKTLDKLSTKERQEFIFQRFGVNVNHLPTHWKRGFCVYKIVKEFLVSDLQGDGEFEDLKAKGFVKDGQTTTRNIWCVDKVIPMFDKDPLYIGKFISTEV